MESWVGRRIFAGSRVRVNYKFGRWNGLQGESNVYMQLFKGNCVGSKLQCAVLLMKPLAVMPRKLMHTWILPQNPGFQR